jgi:hypothetical protein
MPAIYVFDASAMDTVNELDAIGASPFEALNNLHDQDCILFCDLVKDLCRKLYKDETVATWVSPVWRTVRRAAEVPYADITRVIDAVEDLLDDDEEEDSQALKTVALAYKLQREDKEVVVISDETSTLEARCTVKDACAQLGLQCMSVGDLLLLPHP